VISLRDYIQHDGLGLAELVRKKEVQPVELVEAAIQQIELLNPQVNAVIHRLYDEARKAAESFDPDAPFCGVPFLIKDLMLSYAGAPLCNGTRLLSDYVPDHDGELALRFKRAGVIAVGKTNVPEFGYVPVTEPAAFGPSRNPWDLERTPGGSSGGAAAAVAARMVPLAHAGDGGGSIRVPAACCGLFGIKPTRARVPLGPDLGEAWQGCAVEHVISRSVRDSAAMLDAISGPDVGALYWPAAPSRPFLSEIGEPPGKLRIAFSSQPLLCGDVHPECVAGLERAAKLCSDLGHEVTEALPQFDGEEFMSAFMTMVLAEVRASMEDAARRAGRRARYGDFEPATHLMGLLGKRIGAPRLIQAMQDVHRTVRKIGDFFEDYDVFLTPTLARPPVRIGSLRPKGFEATMMRFLARLNSSWLASTLVNIDKNSAAIFSFVPYTAPFNATGQPAMSVPIHWNDQGLPIGVQFVGRYGDEAALFRLASQLEQANPWGDQLPDVCNATE
jgi:amidase